MLVLEELVRQLQSQLDGLNDAAAAERVPDLNGELHRQRRVYLRTASGFATFGPFQAAAGRWVVAYTNTGTVVQQSPGTVRPDDDDIPQNEVWIDLLQDDILLPRWG